MATVLVLMASRVGPGHSPCLAVTAICVRPSVTQTRKTRRELDRCFIGHFSQSQTHITSATVMVRMI